MNAEELKQKAMAGPVERQVLNARDEWLKCDTKEAAHWAARGLKVRDLYDFDSAAILALIAERDELLAALKDARRELAYAGRQEAHDAASAAIAKGGEV